MVMDVKGGRGTLGLDYVELTQLGGELENIQ